MIFFNKYTYSIILLFFSSVAYGESPPIEQPQNPYAADIHSININTLKTTTCQGSLISPSWILTHLKCVNGKNTETTAHFMSNNGFISIHPVERVFKFKQKKLALLFLSTPVNNIQPIKLLRYPLLPEHGKFTATIIQSYHQGEKDFINGINNKKLSHLTKLPFVKQSKGGGWIIETHMLGDVQIGFTLNKNKAIQTSYLAKTIDRVINDNSGESVEWVDRQTLIDTINCEKDGTCIELPECPDGVQDCGDPCDWAIDCTPPAVVTPECPDGVQDCGDPCDWAIDCTPPTVVTPECPDGVQDCGLDPCVVTDNCLPLAIQQHYHLHVASIFTTKTIQQIS
ncbi:trypsin-like serine protease [Photobacterium toruni]|uniref:trypsin-like serine protease n=1 Tax=Photobacterium toruni TaxID=1935446 RepID=UPI002E19DDFF|nr:trypsin-like serine protease [Photobacterium toruni]